MTDKKLVPVEPTPEMMDAAITLIEGGPCFPQDIYAAMLNAAPASPSPPPSAGVDAVAVKALEWAFDAHTSQWWANGPVGRYTAWEISGYAYFQLGTGRAISSGSTADEAKVAAQADFEARIRSALTPAPTPVEAGGEAKAVLDGIAEALESAGYVHMANKEGIASILAELDALAKPAPAVDDRMFWYLRVLDASGGFAQSSGDPGEWVAAFCDDREPTDTYNLAEEQGYTITSHDSRFDSSVVRLTDKGKSALAALAPAAQAGTVAQEGRDNG